MKTLIYSIHAVQQFLQQNYFKSLLKIALRWHRTVRTPCFFFFVHLYIIYRVLWKPPDRFRKYIESNKYFSLTGNQTGNVFASFSQISGNRSTKTYVSLLWYSLYTLYRLFGRIFSFPSIFFFFVIFYWIEKLFVAGQWYIWCFVVVSELDWIGFQ